jgi:riboflavin synthase
MFTGIIESTGIIKEVTTIGSNKTFQVQSSLAPKLKVDQSVSHNGVCLTVEAIISEDVYQVTTIEETLKKTNAHQWQSGAILNLERCMHMNGRLDGHIVQGHVDTTAICTSLQTKVGSWEFVFNYPPRFASLMIEKGSVAVNGVSLTCFNVGIDCFSVAIIPYTYEHTNFNQLQTSQLVNLEFDMVGKYVQRWMELR